jgi:hypothetical protein
MKVAALIRFYESMLKTTGVFLACSTRVAIEATLRALKKLDPEQVV